MRVSPPLKESITPTVYIMEWDEHEQGWGIRPDGCSLHSSTQAWELYIQRHQKSQPKKTPHEYDTPSWDKPRAVECSEPIGALVASRGSLRLARYQYTLDRSSFASRDDELDSRALAAYALAQKEALETVASPPSRAPKKTTL